MEIISNIALISINETLIAQLISFLIFLFLINKVMFRPLQESMAERENLLESLSQEISDTKQEMATLLDQLEEIIEEALNEAFSMRSILEDEGGKKAAAIFSGAQQEIADLKKKTEAEVKQQVEMAKQALDAESESLALVIMEKLLDRRLVS
jgi:F-type H+-transporting ATPase subunit b